MPLEKMPHYGDGPGAGRGHEGQDLFAPVGTDELAIVDAAVTDTGSGYQGGRGNYVSIYSSDTDRTYNYFHMLSPPDWSASGSAVRAGQKLGDLGCTGSCWGPHLHFEMRRGDDEYGPVEDPEAAARDPPPRLRVTRGGLHRRRSGRKAMPARC